MTSWRPTLRRTRVRILSCPLPFFRSPPFACHHHVHLLPLICIASFAMFVLASPEYWPEGDEEDLELEEIRIDADGNAVPSTQAQRRRCAAFNP